MNEVILDITEFVGNPIRTGIQRVVRELIRHWPNPEELTLARFESGRGLVPISRSVVPMLVDADADGLDAEPERLRRLIAAKLGETAPALPDQASILVPELFYDRERCAFYRQLFRCNPKAASFIIYDMIPWLYPNRIGVRSTAPLMPYLQLVRDARRTAFISDKTRSDYASRIRRYADDCGPVLPLGADGLGLERQRFAPTKRSWIAIGAINGNKNQDRILAAFQKLWRDGFDGSLVLIGRVYGMHTPEWLRQVGEEPRFRHLIDPLDAIIAAELSNARATIYVSEIEGFGLPPLESLYAGIPVIVTTSIPSIRDLPSAGQIRLADADISEIAAAVRKTADDAAAERLWKEATTLRLAKWCDFARLVREWIEESCNDCC